MQCDAIITTLIGNCSDFDDQVNGNQAGIKVASCVVLMDALIEIKRITAQVYNKLITCTIINDLLK